jgi:hypothetical protein
MRAYALKRKQSEKNKIQSVLSLMLLLFSLFFSCSLFSITRAEQPNQSLLSFRGNIKYDENDLVTTNLAPIPDGWDLTYKSGPQIIAIDYDVAHDGSYSIRMDPHTQADFNTARECNTGWFAVKPGDHIIFRCWMKTSSAANPANNDNPNYGGARIGIDLYGKDCIIYSHPTAGAECYASFVPFGSDWTLKTWDFVVPDTYFDANMNWGDPDYGVPGSIPPQQVIGAIAWMGVLPVNEAGIGWFSDAELYIIPE